MDAFRRKTMQAQLRTSIFAWAKQAIANFGKLVQEQAGKAQNAREHFHKSQQRKYRYKPARKGVKSLDMQQYEKRYQTVDADGWVGTRPGKSSVAFEDKERMNWKKIERKCKTDNKLAFQREAIKAAGITFSCPFPGRKEQNRAFSQLQQTQHNA